MQQTFNDLCNDRELHQEDGRFGFVFWIFLETAIGIVRERLLLIREGSIKKFMLTNLRSPAIISFILILPFMIMEIVNRRNFNEGFPIPLFAILWLLPILFIVTVMPIIRNVRAGNRLLASPINLVFRVVFLSFIMWMWFGIVIDQMPCFLGVPNCD